MTSSAENQVQRHVPADDAEAREEANQRRGEISFAPTFAPTEKTIIRKAVARDFKSVYTAPTEDEALRMLERVEQTWKSRYPALSNAWRNNRAKVYPMFRLHARTPASDIHLEPH